MIEDISTVVSHQNFHLPNRHKFMIKKTKQLRRCHKIVYGMRMVETERLTAVEVGCNP